MARVRHGISNRATARSSASYDLMRTDVQPGVGDHGMRWCQHWRILRDHRAPCGDMWAVTLVGDDAAVHRWRGPRPPRAASRRPPAPSTTRSPSQVTVRPGSLSGQAADACKSARRPSRVRFSLLLRAPADRLAWSKAVDWPVALDWPRQTTGVTLSPCGGSAGPDPADGGADRLARLRQELHRARDRHPDPRQTRQDPAGRADRPGRQAAVGAGRAAGRHPAPAAAATPFGSRWARSPTKA
jgi:hypothetical protein